MRLEFRWSGTIYTVRFALKEAISMQIHKRSQIELTFTLKL